MGPQEEFDNGLSNVIGLVDGVCEKFSQVRTCPPLPHRLAPAKALTPPPFRAVLACPVRGPVLETASGARPYNMLAARLIASDCGACAGLSCKLRAAKRLL